MRFLKSLLHFYINSSIHVALAVYAFVRITELYFDLPYNKELDYFLFFGTITAYNFVKYFGIAKFHHRSLRKNLKTIQLFSMCCFVLMWYYGAQLPSKVMLIFVPFCVITILYAIPFLSGFKNNLRSIGYLKNSIVALVWTGATVILPVYAVSEPFISVVLIAAIFQRFLLVIVLMLPFEIRDIQFDAISLQTIPRKIGIEKTKKVGYILLVISGVLEFIIVSSLTFRIVFLIAFLALLFLVMRATVYQSKHYSSFWVEAVPTFWYLVLWSSSFLGI